MPTDFKVKQAFQWLQNSCSCVQVKGLRSKNTLFSLLLHDYTCTFWSEYLIICFHRWTIAVSSCEDQYAVLIQEFPCVKKVAHAWHCNSVRFPEPWQKSSRTWWEQRRGTKFPENNAVADLGFSLWLKAATRWAWGRWKWGKLVIYFSIFISKTNTGETVLTLAKILARSLEFL